MSILEKYNKIFTEKDEDGMNEILHDDYKFTMHASGKVLSKSDTKLYKKNRTAIPTKNQYSIV